jgi:hypothetical protein
VTSISLRNRSAPRTAASSGRETFEGDRAFVLVLGEIDGGHPAVAEFTLDAVAVGESGLQAVELVGLVGHGTGLLVGPQLRCGLASEWASARPAGPETGHAKWRT